MPLELNLEHLKDFDSGKAEAAFRKALQTVVRDCMDRGMDGKKRKVVFTVVLDPVVERDGVAHANASFEVAPKLPPFSTAAKPVMLHQRGQASFSPYAPDNPEQSTLMDGTEE